MMKASGENVKRKNVIHIHFSREYCHIVNIVSLN